LKSFFNLESVLHWRYSIINRLIRKIKFPFKRNGLPCCEDEPGSEKIALRWKSSIWIVDTYDMFLFCMPMKDTQNFIQTSWNALILLNIRPRINHFLLINKQCIQMSKGRFSQSQAQMPIPSVKNRSAHCYCYEVYK